MMNLSKGSIMLLCGLIAAAGCRDAKKPAAHATAGKLGVVASGHAAATAAGLRILEQGGNAADAAVATLLALSIKTIGAFCIGGEVPLIYYDATSGAVSVLNGQGGAPLDSAAIAWYYAHGIPGGDIKSAAVPAVISLCVTTLQKHGTMSFAQVAAPSLELLDAGGPGWYRDTSDGDTIRTSRDWYADLAVTLRKLVAAESAAPAAREQRLQAAADRFYRGDIAGELEAWYVAEGSFLRRRDLASHVTRIEKPLTVDYKGSTICKCGPWTQGPWVLQALRLLEGYDLKAMGHNSAAYIHLVAEAMKLALADRDAWYGDPEFVAVPMTQLLSDTYTDLRRPLLDPQQASLELRPGDPLGMAALRPGGGRYAPPGSGTTICVVTDRWGNTVACTPSGLGSRAGTGGSTGVTHGTRLVIFNTWPDHPNRIEAGKRPRTTLTPTLVLRDGRPLLAISVAGGDMQDQAALQIILNVLEFGMDAPAAHAARRFSTNHFIGSFGQDPPRLADLRVPDSLPPDVIAELRQRGHQVTLTRENPGGVAMLQWDQGSGVVTAAGGHSGRLE